jgi:hypothetical protein
MLLKNPLRDLPNEVFVVLGGSDEEPFDLVIRYVKILSGGNVGSAPPTRTPSHPRLPPKKKLAERDRLKKEQPGHNKGKVHGRPPSLARSITSIGRTPVRLARDLCDHVQGNKSVIDTFRRIAERLAEKGD